MTKKLEKAKPRRLASQVFVSLTAEERRELAKRAERDGRSVSGYVRQLVRERLYDEASA